MRVITALVRREEHFVAILSPTLRCETASNWDPELFCPIRLITVRKLPMGGVPIGADRAVADAPLDQLLAVLRIGGQVISRIECSLVVGEEYRAPFFGHRTPAICAGLGDWPPRRRWRDESSTHITARRRVFACGPKACMMPQSQAESQVRTGLYAGGSRIRTLSPTRGSGSLSAINLPRYRRPCRGRRTVGGDHDSGNRVRTRLPAGGNGIRTLGPPSRELRCSPHARGATGGHCTYKRRRRSRRGLARFVLLGEPFHGTNGEFGLGRF